jgi:hypothetical protein
MRGALVGLGFACAVGLYVLGVAIYLFTLYLAYLTSFPSLIFTLFFPFIGQLVWIYLLWSATGVFFNTLTIFMPPVDRVGHSVSPYQFVRETDGVKLRLA